jgi:hypothetical protein
MAILDQRMDLAGDEVDAGRLTVPWRLYSCSRAKVIEFLKLLHAAYPTHTAIKLILDNHSAHASNAPWQKARWLRSTIALAPAVSHAATLP